MCTAAAFQWPLNQSHRGGFEYQVNKPINTKIWNTKSVALCLPSPAQGIASPILGHEGTALAWTTVVAHTAMASQPSAALSSYSHILSWPHSHRAKRRHLLTFQIHSLSLCHFEEWKIHEVKHFWRLWDEKNLGQHEFFCFFMLILPESSFITPSHTLRVQTL